MQAQQILSPGKPVGTLGEAKYLEAKRLGLPDWVAIFARQVYDNTTHPKVVKSTEPIDSFSDQWDKEMEELRALFL